MTEGPWWASGRTPSEGFDHGEDPLDSHARAREGADANGDAEGSQLGAEAVDLLLRLVARATGTSDRREHDTEVCDACPICIGLRAVRQARPEVVTHLAEAANQIALALQALAEAPDRTDGGLQHIDLDP